MVKASGVPAQGLHALASVEAGDLALSFRGQVVAAENGNSAAGELEIKAIDGTRIATLAGLTPPLRLDGLPIAGTLKFAADGSRLTIDRLALNVAGSDVQGADLGRVDWRPAPRRGAARCRRAFRRQAA